MLLFLLVYLGGWHDNQPHMQYFYIVFVQWLHMQFLFK